MNVTNNTGGEVQDRVSPATPKIDRNTLATALRNLRSRDDLPSIHYSQLDGLLANDAARLHSLTEDAAEKALLVGKQLLLELDAAAAKVATQAEGLASNTDEREDWEKVEAAPIETTFQIAIAPTVKQASHNKVVTLTELANMINQQGPVAQALVDELAKQHAPGKALNDAIKVLGPALHFGKFPEGARTRTLEKLEGITGIPFDYDFRNGDRVRRSELMAAAKREGLALICWDTYSSGILDGDDEMTFRGVLPSSESMPSDLHAPITRAAAELLGVPVPGKILPASQAFFWQPRLGCTSNAVAIAGLTIDKALDITKLAPDPAQEMPGKASGVAAAGPLSTDQYADACTVIDALRADGHHLSNGKRVWDRVGLALCTYEQGEELFLRFSDGAPDFSKRDCLKLLDQKRKAVARGGAKAVAGANIGNLFRIATDECGIPNPGAGRRPSAADDFADEMFMAKPEPVKKVAGPPMPAPFFGAHQLLTDAILRSSYVPQPALAGLCALLAMSGIGGNSAYPDGTRSNLYGTVLSESGTGKEVPVECAQSIAITLSVPVISSPASGEALEDSLTHGSLMMIMREAAHIFRVMSGDNAAPHAVSLARMLLDLFSAGSRDKYMKRNKAGKDAPDPIMNPALVAIMASTPAKLGEALSTDNIADGLLGRMLFAMGDPAAARQRTPVKFNVPDGVELMAHPATTIIVPTAVDDAMWEMSLRFDAHRVKLFKADDRVGAALVARRAEKVKRICGTLASFTPDATVTLDMVAWAEKFCAYSDATVMSFTEEYLDKSKDIRDADKVLAAIKSILAGTIKHRHHYEPELIKAGYAPTSLCLKTTHLSKVKFDLAIEHLRDVDEIASSLIDGHKALRLN